MLAGDVCNRRIVWCEVVVGDGVEAVVVDLSDEGVINGTR